MNSKISYAVAAILSATALAATQTARAADTAPAATTDTSGDVLQEITVTADAVLLDQQSSSLGNVVSSQQIVQLPLNGPDDGQFALDRFSTILLGGVVFVVLRSLIRPRLAARA